MLPVEDNLRQRTLTFIQNQKLEDQSIGVYRYSSSVSTPTLYSSTYAVMTRSLYSNLDLMTAEEKEDWIYYFNQHQELKTTTIIEKNDKQGQLLDHPTNMALSAAGKLFIANLGAWHISAMDVK